MKKLVLLLLILPLSINVYGKVSVKGTITYQNTGRCYSVTINWYTGDELNDATSSFDYDIISNYAVVFWGNDKATIMEVGGIVCGSTFTQSCLPLWDETGIDQNGYSWTISTGILSGC